MRAVGPALATLLALAAGDSAALRADEPVTPPEHRRGAEQTLLTFPEWFLVYSPAEYAAFVKTSPPSEFPFLGHILDEAEAFWISGEEGSRQWGPCVDLGEDGREFHYLVKALTANQRAFLVFQLDEGAERVREVLQKVRADALATPRKPENG